MRLSSMVIGILFVGVIITGFYSFAASLASKDTGYNIELDQQYVAKFDRTLSIQKNITADMNEIREEWTVDKSSFLGLVPQAISLAKNVIFLPFQILDTMVTDLASIIGLPDWFIAFVIAAIGVIIIFILISYILRYKYA